MKRAELLIVVSTTNFGEVSVRARDRSDPRTVLTAAGFAPADLVEVVPAGSVARLRDQLAVLLRLLALDDEGDVDLGSAMDKARAAIVDAGGAP